MADAFTQRTAEYGARWTRALRLGVVASVVLHVLLFLVVRDDGHPTSPLSAAGPQAGGALAAGGAMEALEIRESDAEPPETPETLPPEPVEVAVPELTIVLDAVDAAAFAPVEFAFAGLSVPDAGRMLDRGRERAEGEGAGGSADEGRRNVTPPSPRGMILPPTDAPASIRGREIEVWVFVSETGEVVPDSTRILPPTGHRRFERQLRTQAADWVFEPAKRRGEPVAEWFSWVVVM